jgi:antitoxin YefM
MENVSYTELRQNLSRYLDEAVASHAPILVTRQAGKGNVVLVSEEEFSGWQETMHLLGHPANARHVLASVKAADSGQATQRTLVTNDTADPNT